MQNHSLWSNYVKHYMPFVKCGTPSTKKTAPQIYFYISFDSKCALVFHLIQAIIIILTYTHTQYATTFPNRVIMFPRYKMSPINYIPKVRLLA